MKCEKCNQNEANVFYSASINGQTCRQHLCSHCAEELGLNKAFAWPERSLLEESFSGLFGRDPFRRFFGESPWQALDRRMAASVGVLPRTEEQAPEADAELSARRELNALREQLNAAVKAEDYEKAIELRDRIRQLEK